MSESGELERLIADTAIGDRAAFAELYVATSAKLFGVILRILRERQTSEDALQETYLRVWRLAGEFRPDRGKAMAWLVTVARNQALDRRRRQRVIPALEDIGAMELADPKPGPMDCCARNTEARVLKAYLSTLSGPQQRCIWLAFHEGYTHNELSMVLGRPVGTVKSWTRRGLVRLKECIGPERSWP